MLLSEELQLKSNMASVLEEMSLIEDYFLEEFGVELSETEELLELAIWDKFKNNVLGVGGSKAFTKTADGKYTRKGIAGVVGNVRRKLGGEGSKAGLYKRSDILKMAGEEKEKELRQNGIGGKELEARVSYAKRDAGRRLNSESKVAQKKIERRAARAAQKAAKRALSDAEHNYNPRNEQSAEALSKASVTHAGAKHESGVAKDNLGAVKRQLKTINNTLGK